ncbi:hypothetical protein U8607_11080 [Methylobacterium durans]|uniref:hypothetical protein n=1 Tax=Methylobacterium durans TaxID=2202825 RepID=UPI002AFE6447|nr:hypothetical protein [Methylobacterium durans]MEA1832623.1 hypothetical protein [Methylobacterium durans]
MIAAPRVIERWPAARSPAAGSNDPPARCGRSVWPEHGRQACASSQGRHPDRGRFPNAVPQPELGKDQPCKFQRDQRHAGETRQSFRLPIVDQRHSLDLERRRHTVDQASIPMGVPGRHVVAAMAKGLRPDRREKSWGGTSIWTAQDENISEFTAGRMNIVTDQAF